MKRERDEPEASGKLEEFERDLQALLRVEPSTQLAERVRTQLRAADPSRRPVRLLVPAIAAVLALVLLTALLQRRPPAPSASPHAATRESPGEATRPAPPSTGGRPPAPARTRVAPPPREAAAPPQVIVPPGQDEAVLRFVAAVNERGLAAPRAFSESALDAPLPPPASIAIAPLEAAPPSDTADAPARSDS